MDLYSWGHLDQNKIGIFWLELENEVKTSLRNKAESSLLEARYSHTDIESGFLKC